jgi:hypothetical protein
VAQGDTRARSGDALAPRALYGLEGSPALGCAWRQDRRQRSGRVATRPTYIAGGSLRAAEVFFRPRVDFRPSKATSDILTKGAVDIARGLSDEYGHDFGRNIFHDTV